MISNNNTVNYKVSHLFEHYNFGLRHFFISGTLKIQK